MDTKEPRWPRRTLQASWDVGGRHGKFRADVHGGVLEARDLVEEVLANGVAEVVSVDAVHIALFDESSFRIIAAIC